MSDSDHWVVHVMDEQENMSIIGPFEIKEEAFMFVKNKKMQKTAWKNLVF